MAEFFTQHTAAIVGAAILIIGLALGAGDLLRLKWRRAWAISSVCFAESIRRRVLWITPLAILAVIIVTQLQKPLDEQDAIRQTTKFCLFTTGLLITVTAIILACTNLPKEIESRVIFTVVTKPATRLEIVLGKIIGFARVSGSILIIMGLFTLGYLWVRSTTMQSVIAERLETNAVDPISRPTLEHYRTAGLLNAKNYAFPADLQSLAKLPDESDKRHWFASMSEQSVSVRFNMPADFPMPNEPGQDNTAPGLMIRMKVGYLMHPKPAPATQEELRIPFIKQPEKPVVPKISVLIMDTNFNTLLNPRDVNKGEPVELTPTSAKDGVWATVPIAFLPDLVRARDFYVQITGSNPDVDYWVEEKPIQVFVAGREPGTAVGEIEPVSIPGIPDAPGVPYFMGRQGTYGQQVKGEPQIDKTPVAIYRFRNIPTPDSPGGRVPLEFRLGIERSGLDAAEDNDDPTILKVQTRDPATGKLSDFTEIRPESARTTYFSLPAADVHGGNFDLIIRCVTTGHWLGMQPIIPGARPSLSLVVQNTPAGFVMNLVKSMLILWLMSILVISIAICCSTFVSWPTAVVLTIVLLTGHWIIMQMSDTMTPGIGNQVATDFGFRDPASAKVVSSTVEALSKAVNQLAAFLPDISNFDATGDIERGISIPESKIYQALSVVGTFGLVFFVLAYIRFKLLEVAP